MNLEKRVLLWHSRRGMLELDIVLKKFIEEQYDNLAADLQDNFKELLNSSDQELYNWLVKHEPCDNNKLINIIDVITKIRK